MREKTVDVARENRDVTASLLSSGLPNSAEEKVLAALEAAGVRRDVDDLLGHCQRNAVALRDELRQRDIEAMAFRGWASDIARGIVPRDIDEAEGWGCVHWWVEARIHNEWFVFDLAANCSGADWGDLYVATDRPGEYRPVEIDPPEMDAVREEYSLEPPRGLWDEPL